MSYPKMNKSPRRTVGAPSLQGGMNLRDALNMCQDNQLTDSLNMWFRDGVLKTRPGKKNTAKIEFSWINDTLVEGKIKVHREASKIVDGITYTLVSVLNYSTYNGSFRSGVSFFWVNDNEIIEETLNTGNTLPIDGEITNYFVVTVPQGILLFLKYFSNSENKYVCKIYKCTDENDWNELTNEEIYTPVVMTNCKTADKNGYSYSGVQADGYNLISPYYKVIYSTVNKADGFYKMRYKLPIQLPISEGNGKSYIITAKHTYVDSSGNVNETTHEVVWKPKNTTYFETVDHSGDDKLYMFVNADYVMFSDVSNKDGSKPTGYDTPKTLTDDDFLEDNLVITAVNELTEQKNKVFSMTQSSWFGGASEGINGGTRLFLGGSTEIENKSLMLWSGLNEPLYFPENCESYVGNSMSALKGFGKQEDMLVIFKENEIYYTKYAQNPNITAESLINQAVVDYQASSVYFPLVQINPVIGCLSADSIKLCRNRLVWLGQDKKVYTLAGASQYSERNVFCVSEMIDRSLKAESDLKASYALDFDGHYMLVVGTRAYLMDYNSYGYQYAYSYQKAEDANIKIPWYIWDGVSDEYSLLFNVNDKLCGITYKYATEPSVTNNNASKIELYSFTGDSDNGEPIHSMAQTKFFDFGNPNYRKNIEAVGVSFGNNGGEPITVKFITEAGEDYATVTLYDDETDSRNAGFITSRILYPAIRSAVRFGVRFECEGDMALEGLNITYRTLGGAR